MGWTPHEGPQSMALSRPENEILYGGARGGGKTDAGLAWLTREAANPLYRFLVIRRNDKDLSDWLDRAKTFLAPCNAQIVGRPAVIRFPSGAMGRVGHLKDANAYDHYQGHEYSKMLFEELTQIPKESSFQKILSSNRSTSGIKPQVFLTTNPGGPGHNWVKARYIQNGKYKCYKDPISGRTRIFIPAKLTDNPTLMDKDPTYEAYLKSLPEQTRKAWLDGNWDVFEGQFFNSFDSEVHVCEPFAIPNDWAKYVSVDYGYSAPSVCLWFVVSPDGRVYQYRELYRTGLTYEMLRDEILTLSAGEKIENGFVDPALKAKAQGTGMVGLEVLNDQKKQQINFWPADNNRFNGWARLREYYRVRYDSEGKPYAWLKIFDTCHQTLRSVPELVHDAVQVEDLDTDGDDHCADTQRYFVMGRPIPHAIQKEDKYKKMRPQDASLWKYVKTLKTNSEESYEY